MKGCAAPRSKFEFDLVLARDLRLDLDLTLKDLRLDSDLQKITSEHLCPLQVQRETFVKHNTSLSITM